MVVVLTLRTAASISLMQRVRLAWFAADSQVLRNVTPMTLNVCDFAWVLRQGNHSSGVLHLVGLRFGH